MTAPDRPTRERDGDDPHKAAALLLAAARVDPTLRVAAEVVQDALLARDAEVRALRAELTDGGRPEDRWALDDIAEQVGFVRDAHPSEIVVAVRAVLAARTPHPAEPTTGNLLRAAAAGRREYAQGCGGTDNTKLQEMHDALLTQAATLDGAARVADGDMGPLYGWLPSWRWTPEMERRVLSSTSGSTSPADVAGVVLAAPLPAVPDGEDEPSFCACTDKCGGVAVDPTCPIAQAKQRAGEDVPARLDAAADACANVRESPASRETGMLLRRAAAWLRTSTTAEVQAAVAAALAARPTGVSGG